MDIFPLAKTDLGPAAKCLIKKIAGALGTVYSPVATILQAHADVISQKIRTKGEIEIKGVRKRALQRLMAEEVKAQQSLEAIYLQSLELVNPGLESATIDQIDDDWIVFHSAKARLVSDAEMRTLWARILVSEAEAPGSYSKRTLELLSILEKTEAHLFTTVCRFAVRANSETIPAILYEKGLPKLYTDHGISFTNLRHLDQIGLMHYTTALLTNTVRLYDVPTFDVEYFGEHRRFRTTRTNQGTGKPIVYYGIADLTRVGRQLAKIAGSERVDGFFDFLEAEWLNHGISREQSPDH